VAKTSIRELLLQEHINLHRPFWVEHPQNWCPTGSGRWRRTLDGHAATTRSGHRRRRPRGWPYDVGEMSTIRPYRPCLCRAPLVSIEWPGAGSCWRRRYDQWGARWPRAPGRQRRQVTPTPANAWCSPAPLRHHIALLKNSYCCLWLPGCRSVVVAVHLILLLWQRYKLRHYRSQVSRGGARLYWLSNLRVESKRELVVQLFFQNWGVQKSRFSINEQKNELAMEMEYLKHEIEMIK
jgi:hypothetical protein